MMADCCRDYVDWAFFTDNAVTESRAALQHFTLEMLA
jgi:hypothetical protein